MTPADMDGAAALVATVFGRGPQPSEAIRREIDLVTEPDRMFVVHDGPAVVGIGGAYTFDVALPGDGHVPMSGVTAVGVAPTHRRRGMLQAIMGVVLDQAVEREEPVAGLTASETTIYRRFGFGVATRFQHLSLDIRRLRLARATAGRGAPGAAEAAVAAAAALPPRLRLVGEDEAAVAIPAVWERHWRRYPGELSRNPAYFQALALDPEEDRYGATARFVVLHHDGDGEPDGVAVYRLHFGWASGSDNTLHLEDLAAADDAVEAELLRYLLDVDLITRFEWRAPLDHPMRWWLADPRALGLKGEVDHLWLRPLDVARCLSERRYATAGGFVVEVVDDHRPAVGGRFRLDAGPGGADCTRTTASADLALDVADLGALLLGGVRWNVLGRAGLVDEHTPGALARADLLFRPDRTPYCGTEF
jgi:predicted acetyltransferase